MDDSNKLIVFTRFPVEGESKTRMIPVLGAKKAADLQRSMTEFTLLQARKTGARIEVRFTGGDEAQMREWLGDDLEFVDQGEGDLGDRMKRAFKDNFDACAGNVVIVGCDCPSNRSYNIKDCFEVLDEYDCVIGPTEDGGYYMIGLNRMIPEFFEDIDWGTDQVLEQSLMSVNIDPVLFPELCDVDYPEDIPDRISVIIPVLDDTDYIEKSIESISGAFDYECIVVDGGSKDNTLELVKKSSAKLIEASAGRAKQMNAGAEIVRGDILLFLHADAELPENWDETVRTVFKDPRVTLGAFSFKVKERLKGIEFIEKCVDFRSNKLSMPYGDQGLFVKWEVFKKIGGFSILPIMEDVDFVKKVRKLGKVNVVRNTVQVSGRRWMKLGVIRTTLINQIIITLSILGVDPNKLRKLYDKGSFF